MKRYKRARDSGGVRLVFAFHSIASRCPQPCVSSFERVFPKNEPTRTVVSILPADSAMQ